MNGSFLKGPLPFLLIAGAALFAYKYMPLGDIIERFRSPSNATPVATSSVGAASRGADLGASTNTADAAMPGAADPSPSLPEAANPPAGQPVQRESAIQDASAMPQPLAPGVARQSAQQGVKVQGPAVQAPPVIAALKPTLRILVEAETDAGAGLDEYTPTAYAELLHRELVSVASVALGEENIDTDSANRGFREEVAEGRPGIERLCQQAGADRLLLADVTTPKDGFSATSGGVRPEAKFAAISCRDGRLHKSPRKRIEPHRLDRFEYQQGFAERARRFVLSQAYFLKP